MFFYFFTKELKRVDCRGDIEKFKDTIKGNFINLLLVFVPFGFVAGFAEWNATVVFFLNFVGMIPLASILGDATEFLSAHVLFWFFSFIFYFFCVLTFKWHCFVEWLYVNTYS